MSALRYILLAALASPLFAQCSMCYQNAAASGPQGIRALKDNPPIAIGACLARLAYRCRDSNLTTSRGPLDG